MYVSEFSPNPKDKVKIMLLYSLILVVVMGFGIGVMTIASSFRSFVESKTSQKDYDMYPSENVVIPGESGVSL